MEDEMVEEQCGFRKGRSYTDLRCKRILKKERNTMYQCFFYSYIKKRHTIT